MKNNRLITTLIALFILGFRLNTQTALTGETAVQKERRMEWFSQVKLGTFTYWGTYAVSGVSENRSFFNNYLPYEEYMAQEKGFTVSAYNPQEWVKLIEESDVRYTVITIKHRDGVALWDTKVGDSSAVKSTPTGRDLIAPFMKEVRKQGLGLGSYYSPFDWSYLDYSNKTRTGVCYKGGPGRWAKFINFSFGQPSEPGKAWKPDFYWFDGDWRQTVKAWDSKGIINLLCPTNPDVVVNSRIQGYDDYATSEQGIPAVRPVNKYWEFYMTMNDSWDYQHTNTNCKALSILLRIFIDHLSMGGNLLLDIGPKEDETISAEQTAVLKEFGRQTKRYKEAIYETHTGIPREYFQGYTTPNKAGDIPYLYLSYKPDGLIEVKELVNRMNRVWVVDNGAMSPYKAYNKNYWSEMPGSLYIDTPECVQDEQITMVAVLLDDPIKPCHGVGQVTESN